METINLRGWDVFSINVMHVAQSLLYFFITNLSMKYDIGKVCWALKVNKLPGDKLKKFFFLPWRHVIFPLWVSDHVQAGLILNQFNSYHVKKIK